MAKSPAHIFSGLTILDLTKVYSGPLATRYLADYGAKVIKIENPESPDPSRSFPPLRNGASGYYEILNRNKTGIFLNLKNEADKQQFLDLVKSADVVVENMSPSAKHKLGTDYAVLTKINPRLIYASLSGKDQGSNDKYFDVIAQAESGLMSLTGTPSSPTKIGPAVVDAFSGVNLAFAISSALYYREVTGLGQALNISMLASAMNMLEQNLVEYSVSGNNPVRPGNHDNAIAPFGIYKTKDGFVALAVGSESLWATFLSLFPEQKGVHNLEFADNSLRLSHQAELTTAIELAFAKWETDKLVNYLKVANLPVAKIAEMSDLSLNNWFVEHGALVKYSHPQLGSILVPGKSIEFGADTTPANIQAAPQLPENKYAISELSSKNLLQLTNLLDTCFHMTSTSKETLINWKYFLGLEGSSLLQGAFLRDELVAFYSNKAIPVSDQDSSYQAGICLDMCTHPKYRGQKLISKLSRSVYEKRSRDKFHFSFGFSNREGIQVDKHSQGYGYQVIGKFGRYLALTKRGNSKITIVPAQGFHSFPTPQLLHIAQTPAFLSWRYLEKPNNNYQLVDLVEAHQTIAQAILIEGPHKLEVFKLILPDLKLASRALLALRLYGRKIGKKYLIIRVLPNKDWSQILRLSGFHRFAYREDPYYLTVKVLPEGQSLRSYFLDPNSWFLMGGDVL